MFQRMFVLTGRITALLLGLCSQHAFAGAYESTDRAITSFAQHRFNEGQSILTERLGDSELNPAEHGAILITLGDFYCDYVGDFSKGVELYQQAAEFSSGTDALNNPRLQSILSARTTYASIDAIVQKIVDNDSWKTDGSDIAAEMETLQAFMRNTPDYYRMAEAHYAQALVYAFERHDMKALAEFNRVQAIKPAISLFLPVERQMDFMQGRLNRAIATYGGMSLFVVLLVLSQILFFLAKPWRWLTFKMIGKFVVVLMILNGGFIALGHVLAVGYRRSEAVSEQFSVGENYLFTALLSPGFDLYFPLLLYLSVAFLMTYMFTLGVTKLCRRKAVGSALSGVAGALMMSSLMCLFYMQRCDAKTARDPELSPECFFSTAAGLQFTVKGIEPYLLTAPEQFTDPGVSHNTNPALEEWAKKHCPFSQKDAPDGQ
ncbi:MAG: hypothetical protein FJ220_03160 [Kiritimatiellaceae bacterium]|nr:hypothetical protein [Kiritimatiellaceae bacterium]